MIPINEIFATLQGEASHMGVPSVFIRTQGCDVGCGWCDTKHTWEEKQFDRSWTVANINANPERWKPMTEDEIIDYVSTFKISHVVITGGEPLMHDLTDLIGMLVENGFSVQIETSGTRPVAQYAQLCWITCSPKFNMAGGLDVLREAIIFSDELKLPVGKPADIERFDDHILVYGLTESELPPIYLQPLSQSPKATKLCVTECMKRGWILSPQMHKYIGIE